MTVTIPVGLRTTDLVTQQSKISTLAARPSTAPDAAQSAQQLNYEQQNLVLALIDRGALSATAILSTVSYRGTNAILSAITALSNNITTWTTTNPQLATSSAFTLEQLRRQAVTELMASGQMSAASVLSTMAYAGSF